MKKYFILSVLAIIISFSSFGQGHDIKVKIKNIKDSVCYLGYYYGSQKFVQDTSVVKGESVRFHGKDKLSTGIYFVYTPSNIFFEVLINTDQEFELETDTLGFVENMKVTNSDENELFSAFQRFMSVKQKLAGEYGVKMKELEDEEANKVREKIRAINKEVKAYQKNIVDNNPDLFLTKIIKATLKPDIPEAPKDENGKQDPSFAYNYYKAHFFDNIDLSNDDMLRTPVFAPKIDEYMDKLTVPTPDSIAVAAERIIERSRPNPLVFRYLLVTMTSKYETSKMMCMDKVFVHLAEKFYLTGAADWIDSATYKKFEDRVNQLKPNLCGKVAEPLVILDSTLSKWVSLHDIDANYTVLFFFDPDCGHCKKKTPIMKKASDNLKDKGVAFFGICTVSDTDKWKKYIKEKKLDWYHGVGPSGENNFRDNYNVVSTPTIYVLDKDKRIIAKRIDAEKIQEFVEFQLERDAKLKESN